MLGHPFPGNVRELENIIQAAVALAPGDVITEHDLRIDKVGGSQVQSSGMVPLKEIEGRHIDRVLRAVGGNRQEAAQQAIGNRQKAIGCRR